MAKTNAMRSAAWRRRLLLKSTFFDDLNTDRAARIRQAFPGDERPEVRAVVEFFANYPRCQQAPASVEITEGNLIVDLAPGANEWEMAAANAALRELSSLTIFVTAPFGGPAFRNLYETVCDEVAEMRALGLWGRS